MGPHLWLHPAPRGGDRRPARLGGVPAPGRWWPRRHRLAYAPLLFAAILVPGVFDPGSFLEDGISGGALGVPVIAMLGGLAISGHRHSWARILAGLTFTAGLVVWLLTAVSVGGDSFALGTTQGLWVSTLYEGLLVTFALAASVPNRPSVRRDLGQLTAAFRPQDMSNFSIKDPGAQRAGAVLR